MCANAKCQGWSVSTFSRLSSNWMCVLVPHFEVFSYFSFILPGGCFSVYNFIFKYNLSARYPWAPKRLKNWWRKGCRKKEKNDYNKPWSYSHYILCAHCIYLVSKCCLLPIYCTCFHCSVAVPSFFKPEKMVWVSWFGMGQSQCFLF